MSEIRAQLPVSPLEQFGFGPVVQRRRLLAYTQATAVRFRPGLLGPGTPIGRAARLKPGCLWVRLPRWALHSRLGRQSADHSRLERGMLWVRVPPEPVKTTRPRGAAWSARLPVKQEITGSNPVGDAFCASESWHGTQTGKAAKLKPW